jgi:hypothetical protein
MPDMRYSIKILAMRCPYPTCDTPATCDTQLGTTCLILVSFSGNILVCLAVWRNTSLRTSCNYFIVSLALTDITISILGSPLSLVVGITGRMVLPDWLCQAQAYVLVCFGILSLVTMTQTAIHRYLKVAHPTRCATKRTVLRIITLTWIVMLLFPSPYFATNKAIFYPGELYCFMNIENMYKDLEIPGAIVSITFPFGIMTFCYGKVFSTVRKHKQRTKNTLQAFTRYQRKNRLSQEETRITMVLVAVVVGFIVCWSPFFCIWMLTFYKVSLPRRVHILSSTFAGLSSCVNPFIYGVLNKGFKAEFKRILLGCKIWPNVTEPLNHQRQMALKKRNRIQPLELQITRHSLSLLSTSA